MNIAPHCWTRWPPQKNNVSLCPRCPFLHRTAGDTERRYHLRYYKTGSCIHETDAKGHCSKNGSHCAFAHGSHDLRSPVYDIRCGDHFILTFDLLSVSACVCIRCLCCWRSLFTLHFSTGRCRWWSLREARGPQREVEETDSRQAPPSSRRYWARSHAGKVDPCCSTPRMEKPSARVVNAKCWWGRVAHGNGDTWNMSQLSLSTCVWSLSDGKRCTDTWYFWEQ